MTTDKFVDITCALRLLNDQLIKETGAFSKGVNKGLNIARSALKNKQITPPIDPDTLPIVRELREKLEEVEKERDCAKLLLVETRDRLDKFAWYEKAAQEGRLDVANPLYLFCWKSTERGPLLI